MKPIRHTFFALLILAPALPSAWADALDSLESSQLLRQRSAFVAAEQALGKRQHDRYRELKADLRDYPLYPYLEYEELAGNLSRAGNSEVDRFLAAYGDTPLAPRLRSAWLAQLAKQGRWQEYIRYDKGAGSSARRCVHLRALLETGRRNEAFSQVPKLWLYGRSRPKECDPVFQAWRNAGLLTQELVWERIELAMDAGQLRLARYLGRFLAETDRSWLERWLKAYESPALVLKGPEYRRPYSRRNEIALDAVKRAAKKDPEAAMRMWQPTQRIYSLTAEQIAAGERELALALARKRDPESLRYLDRVEPADDDLPLHEARLRAALAHGDWERVLAWIAQLPADERESERWRYWRARALDTTGHPEEAQTLFKALSGGRSYFGFLAADIVGAPYNLTDVSVAVTPQAWQSLAGDPGIRRAHELYRLGRMTDARREWSFATRDLDQHQLQAAAKLAQSWDWHDRAIFTLARTGYWDDLELRFPLSHRQQIERNAAKQDLETAWVFAIVRQESAFMQDARSRAGALGLMQLMPATAHTQAKRMKVRSPKSKDLMHPDTNIRLGAGYLGLIYERLDRNPVLATAAYNAGPHRVQSWLPERDLPADVWVETIPFRETRRYVERVMTYTAIYQSRLGQTPVRLTERMRPVSGSATIAVQTPPNESGAKG